eukprot:scaffold157112_cov35-Tisochrysis_lutea.AAC.1
MERRRGESRREGDERKRGERREKERDDREGIEDKRETVVESEHNTYTPARHLKYSSQYTTLGVPEANYCNHPEACNSFEYRAHPNLSLATAQWTPIREKHRRKHSDSDVVPRGNLPPSPAVSIYIQIPDSPDSRFAIHITLAMHIHRTRHSHCLLPLLGSHSPLSSSTSTHEHEGEGESRHVWYVVSCGAGASGVGGQDNHGEE